MGVIKKADKFIRKNLSKKRYAHVKGTVETALILNRKYKVDKKKLILATILHDVGRSFSEEEMVEYLRDRGESIIYDKQSRKGLLHAQVGYYIAKDVFKVNDIEVLEAIRYHTTGARSLSLLSKIVYAADYLDPGRNLSDRDDIAEIMIKDFNKGLLMIIKSSIDYILSRNNFIEKDSIDFYNETLLLIQRGSKV